MVNTDEFIKRLEIILDYYSLNASAFADKIGVQRSSLSHLLSGRNKPSLDFILKILEEFPEVDLYWMLNGKGNFPKNEGAEIKPTPAATSSTKPVADLFLGEKQAIEKPLVDNSKTVESCPPATVSETEIEKIVVFYKNGTFKSYLPEF